MGINELKESLRNKLAQTFKNDEIQTNFKKGYFVVAHEQYTLRFVIDNEELSYLFSLNDPVNGLTVGLGENYEILSHASESEMEEVLQDIHTDIDSLLENIVNDEVYIGYEGKTSYVAYRYQDGYRLSRFKKAMFLGVSMQEESVDKNTIKKLALKPLSQFLS